MDLHAEMVKTIDFIKKLKTTHQLETNFDALAPLLYVGVATAEKIKKIQAELMAEFGEPYKPTGSTAFFMNLFNPFVRGIGGAKSDQTLFRRDITPTVTLYCALWPWGSDPNRTSVRIGIYCEKEEEAEPLVKEFGHKFD